MTISNAEIRPLPLAITRMLVRWEAVAREIEARRVERLDEARRRRKQADEEAA